ncbi:MAG: c-type cytochrome [Planctomycetaceae bacterium]|nr:c-type cytochrome [Planctomycetales bacterium]MCB9922063.1 c-type cytochrome [Planctomycetaceae bacterium]
MAEGNQQFGGGHAHCDAMIYLGDRWPECYRGALFTSNIHGRRINRDQLVRTEGPFRGIHDDDFLLADDSWFRAVSMEYGPDGDVYLTDWSDNGECHDRDGVHRTSGRIYKITWGEPKRVEADLAAASNEQLVQYQLHKNDWFVRHARRLLQERAATGHDMSSVNQELRSWFDSDLDVTRKLRALWALYSTNGADKEWLIGLLKSNSEHLRCWAIRLLTDAPGPDQTITDALTQAAGAEASWLVRMELASALRRLPVTDRFDVAIPLTRRAPNVDPNIDRMIWYAVEPAVADNPQRGVAFAATAPQPLMRWTAKRLAAHSSDSIGLLFAAAERSKNLEFVANVLSGFSDVIESLDSHKVPESAQAAVLRLMDHSEDRIRLPALTIAAAIGDEVTVQRVRQVVHDSTQKDAARLAVLAGLAKRGFDGLAEDLQRLIAAGQMTTAALRASSGVHSVSLLETILDHYPKMSPDERITAIDVLVSRADGARLLMSSVERNEFQASDISATQARQIAALKDGALVRRLESLWGTVRQSSAERLTGIRELELSLTPEVLSQADLTEGREVFRKTCSMCHRLFSDGRTIGPELTGANRRSLHYLLSNIVDPSAAVPADFRQATVVTTNGRVITGAISQRTEAQIAIQTVNGEVRLRSEDVEELTISPQSMMPDGLLEKLNDNQKRDLIGWLMSDGVEAVSALDTEGQGPNTKP